VVNCGGLLCAFYLTPPSCLGTAGPISAFGPLGALGPLGTNTWNPSAWMSGIGDWSAWAKSIQANTSVPLSNQGPLNPEAYYHVLPSINDFGKQLQAEGLWTVLGPLGPLGALGGLGPLGPMGVHGYARDDAGNYVHDGVIQRKIDFPWDAAAGVNRTWSLYEMYVNNTAVSSVTDQDTSWLALSTLIVGPGYIQTPDLYTFHSFDKQFVTVTIVPENVFDSFELEILDSRDRVIMSSKETIFINWIQFLCPSPGATYTARVRLGLTARFSPFGYSYRIYVTGSSDMFQQSDITGPHRSKC